MPSLEMMEGKYAAYRCLGRSRVHGRQCLQFAAKGAKYCKFHGGRRKALNNPGYKGLKHLRYAKYLGMTLRKYIDESAANREALIELRDELALMRGLAAQSIELYETFNARSVGGEGGFSSPQEKGNAVARATALMIETLNQVRDMAMAAAKIEQKDSLGSESLNAIIIQVVNSIDLKVRDVDEKMIAAGIDPESFVTDIANHLKNNIRMLKNGVTGVDHTPADLVNAMDEMQ